LLNGIRRGTVAPARLTEGDRQVTGSRPAVAIVLLCAPLTLAAQGPDELWEVTMKMEMAGAPVQMPEQTQRVCKPKGKGQEADVPADNKCKLVDSKQSGRKRTFKMACEDGKNKYTVTGETESTGPDNYRGRMQTTGTMDGEPMNMTQAFSGKKVGGCTYEDPAKKQQEMMAQSNAMLAQECRKSIDELQSVMFTMDGSPCASLKPEFCAKVGKVATEMRDPAGFRKYSGKDWQGSMKACSQDPLAVRRDACQASAAKRDWSFVADLCADEAQALAKQHCEGRTYTAAMSSEYAAICSRYAGNLAKGDVAAPPPTGAEAKPSTGDSLKKGADKLKKFLKF
jgi:hypothetical protein